MKNQVCVRVKSNIDPEIFTGNRELSNIGIIGNNTISDLTRPDIEWSWTSSHDKAFEEVKHLLTVAPVLAYFDPSKELSIQCDASAQGLGAALLQEGRPLAYGSRALSNTETRYATIEKEMLAIVFALEKWHQYTFGRPLTVYSDHKPLEAIMKKPLDRVPK